MRHCLTLVVAAVLPTVLGCGSPAPAAGAEPIGTTSAAVTSGSIATLALANVGGSACGTNSLGGNSFDSSCTGNGGQPEYWCADFAKWVWENLGVPNTNELTAAAGSFYVYGQNHGTLSNNPAAGDAVVFNYQGGGVADHVALVTKVNSDGTIETASGDWAGQSGSEAFFSSTSHVVLNTPAYDHTVGTAPGVMGMTISGFIAPIGLAAASPYGAGYVSQSFPLASTAFTMFAGQTLHETIVLKNLGAKAWDGNTHLGTSQPRDRASAFAATTWISPSRLTGVSGSVAPGGTYSFAFDFHAPAMPGTYHEYFNLVEEGVAWFSDPGQGGPPDDDLEASIVVVPGVRGHLDGSDCTAITGWTQDQAAPGTAIQVELSFDGPLGQAGVHSILAPADVSRPDLCTAIGSCVHGFSVPPPAALLDGLAHKVYAYGVAESGAGPNELLGGGPTEFTCTAPPGSEEAGAGWGDGGAPGQVLEAGPSPDTDAGSPVNAPQGETPANATSAGCSVTRGVQGDVSIAWVFGLGLIGAFVCRRRR